MAKGEPITRNWLKIAAYTRIVRHVKIRADANPYDPADAAYFANRKEMQRQNRKAKPTQGCELGDIEQLVTFLNLQSTSPKPRPD